MLIVQKFGGTSVGDIERIRNVARILLDTQNKGNQVVAVVSAMAGETNRLVDLATRINPQPWSREYDMLLASGEQVAVALVSLALNSLAGRPVPLAGEGGRAAARPLLGHQIGIRTDSVYSKARIEAIDTSLLRAELERGVIPVVAGFQGVDVENNITTLGRGGSDTSAVALAAALKADECEIFTDVDGVYTTDPRLCARARKIDRISYEEMMELASLGAKVLQIRSVELAAKYKVPIHVRSSFIHDAVNGLRPAASINLIPGTRVVEEGKIMEHVVVSGIAADSNDAKITINNLPERAGVAADIFGALADEAVVVDVIVQNLSRRARAGEAAEGRVNLSFTVPRAEAARAVDLIQSRLRPKFPGIEVSSETGLAKVSIVGVGMRNHPGVAAKMFRVLAEADVSIKLITTSEIKISVLIPEDRMKHAVERLHAAFELDRTA